MRKASSDRMQKLIDSNVVRAFRQIGCERITFGSDYPFGNLAGDIRRIESLALTDEEKRMILGENSRRLYFNQSDEPGGLTE
jgi:predicted TIM-barrel fold metal-dependent hydrolase